MRTLLRPLADQGTFRPAPLRDGRRRRLLQRDVRMDFEARHRAPLEEAEEEQRRLGGAGTQAGAEAP